jgi:hypothetical protein
MGVEMRLASVPDEFEKEKMEGMGMVKGRKAEEHEARKV